MTDAAWSTLSNQFVAAAAGVYFLALLSSFWDWSSSVGKRSVSKQLVAAGPAALDQDAAATTEPTQPESTTRRVSAGRLAFLLTMVAALLHLGGLIARGLAAEPNRVPWSNMYEFTLSGTFVVAVLYVAMYRRYKLAWMGPFVTGFVLTFLMVAVLWLYAPVVPLSDALSSYWLVIHVVSAIIATGAFTLGGIASLAYLLKARRPGAEQGMVSRFPSLETLDKTGYRIHAFAFPVWTFAVLITGPIWAYEAWSSYWNWDPKEVWAFITWVVYAAYLHARATAGWKGKKAAWLALLGLATLWFNFIGINYFSTSSQHSYAAGQLQPGPSQASLLTRS